MKKKATYSMKTDTSSGAADIPCDVTRSSNLRVLSGTAVL